MSRPIFDALALLDDKRFIAFLRRSPRITIAEIGMLLKWKQFLVELASGTRTPQTDAQAHFLGVICGQRRPNTIYEKSYLNFLGHKKEFEIELAKADTRKIQRNVERRSRFKPGTLGSPFRG